MASEQKTDVSRYVFVKTFSDIDEYPLANCFPFFACLVGAYLLFVLKIGPDFMKNRKPYKLKNAILLYNAVQVLLSALFCYLALECLVKSGLFPRNCCEDDPETRQLMLRTTYMYILGKITELLDTVFFVLRKKYNQVSFLHVYHHASVVLGTWMMFKYSVNQTAIYAGFINSLVHVIMYMYYFVAALGPQYQKYLTWKKYITTFQLVQFVSVFAHQVVMLFITENCTHAVIGIIYVFFSTILFYKLFSNFYNQSYKKAANSQKKANYLNGAVIENTQNGIKNEDALVANGHKTKVRYNYKISCSPHYQ